MNKELYSNPHWKNGGIGIQTKIKYLIRKMFYTYLLKRYCKNNKTILDVGCGFGQFMKIAEKLGFKATGIDADYKYRNNNVFTCDLWHFKGKYDIVFNSMILEHMENQTKFIKKMASLSNNIVITISAYLSKGFYDTPDHTKPVTKIGVKWMFNRCGFRTLMSMHIPFYHAVAVVSKKVTEKDDDLELKE